MSVQQLQSVSDQTLGEVFRRFPKFGPVHVHNPSGVHRPQIVHHQATMEAQVPQIVNAPNKSQRRDSNRISPTSDDDHSPG